MKKDLFEASGPSGVDIELSSASKIIMSEEGGSEDSASLAKKKEGEKEEESKEGSLPVEKKSKTNRCATCRKKVGLLGESAFHLFVRGHN